MYRTGIGLAGAAILLISNAAPSSAESSAAEIRKVVAGRTCHGPGQTYRFGGGGSYSRTHMVRGRMETGSGTYSVSDGLITLYGMNGNVFPLSASVSPPRTLLLRGAALRC